MKEISATTTEEEQQKNSSVDAVATNSEYTQCMSSMRHNLTSAYILAAYNVVARDNETDCIEEQASPDVAFSPEVSLVYEVPLQIKNVPVPLHVCVYT